MHVSIIAYSLVLLRTLVEHAWCYCAPSGVGVESSPCSPLQGSLAYRARPAPGLGPPFGATCKASLLPRLQGIPTLCLLCLPCSPSHARRRPYMCPSPPGEQPAVRSRPAPQRNLHGILAAPPAGYTHPVLAGLALLILSCTTSSMHVSISLGGTTCGQVSARPSEQALPVQLRSPSPFLPASLPLAQLKCVCPERGSLSRWGEKNPTAEVLAYSAESDPLLAARAVPSAPPLFPLSLLLCSRNVVHASLLSFCTSFSQLSRYGLATPNSHDGCCAGAPICRQPVLRTLCFTSSRIIYQQSGRTKSLFEAHGSRHPTRRRRCLW